MFYQLFWKEWRENLWKLSFCLGVSLAFTLLLFRTRLLTDHSNCLIISLIMTFVVPVVYALDLFAGEMSNRTIHLLFKIPVPRGQIYFSKMLCALLGLALTFVITGLVMELMAQGRETDPGMLLGIVAVSGCCAALILAWFSVLGCQNRSEAASLIAMAGVLIGWGIVFFWATICEVRWAAHFAPYTFTLWNFRQHTDWLNIPLLFVCQSLALVAALTLACYRYVKIRRYL